MSETNRELENAYARGPLIKSAIGPIFPVYDQSEVGGWRQNFELYYWYETMFKM